jgi:hypothetical protein
MYNYILQLTPDYKTGSFVHIILRLLPYTKRCLLNFEQYCLVIKFNFKRSCYEQSNTMLSPYTIQIRTVNKKKYNLIFSVSIGFFVLG